MQNLSDNNTNLIINPRRHNIKKVTQRHKEGGGSIGPLPSTFNTIHPIDFTFGTYNELLLYIQLIKTTWCLISFHSNHSCINYVTSDRHLGDFSIFELNTENDEKTAISDWNLQSCQFLVTSLAKSQLNYRSQDTSCVSDDDVINRDVT